MFLIYIHIVCTYSSLNRKIIIESILFNFVQFIALIFQRYVILETKDDNDHKYRIMNRQTENLVIEQIFRKREDMR